MNPWPASINLRRLAIAGVIVVLLGVAAVAQTAGSSPPQRPGPVAPTQSERAYLPIIEWTNPSYQAIYTSRNLEGHELAAECNPDGGTDCPCTAEDISMTSLPDHGEVTSNPRLMHTYVNAIGYHKFYETFPDGAPVSLGTYVYAGQFSIPVVPVADVGEQENAQTMQLMIQLWDGRDALFPSLGATLEGVVYWDLNPWSPTFGHIQVYTGTNALDLVETGLVLPPDLDWHRFRLVVDLETQRYVSLTIDGQVADLSALTLARVSHPEWGNDVSLIITTESMATYPQYNCLYIFTWTGRYRNLQFGRLQE
jgi:hypothetical protein